MLAFRYHQIVITLNAPLNLLIHVDLQRCYFLRKMKGFLKRHSDNLFTSIN